MSFSHIDIWNHMGFSAKFVNFVLLLMGVAALSVLIERVWTFSMSSPTSEVQAAGLAARHEGLGRSGQRRAMDRTFRANRHELLRGVRSLLTIGLTAPLVGLAGMVAGFTNAFRGMALTGSGGLGAISAGLAEALVPFAAGLVIGLIAIWSYAYLQRRVESLNVQMRRAVTR